VSTDETGDEVASASSGDSAAFQLQGMSLGGGWHVVSVLPRSDERSGSAFSVGYLASCDDGRFGYLKALDYASALGADDPPSALARLVDAYNFERDLLWRIGDRKLSRVVQILDASTVQIPDAYPVSYLILELADGDAHDMLDDGDQADCLHKINIAHDAAVGLSQLHSLGVMHQDVKPSNLLGWKEPNGRWRGKIGDLGAAHASGVTSPNEDALVPGDPSYAAPEVLYRQGPLDARSWRLAADMYMFGNLLAFLVTGVSFSGIQALYLERSLRWNAYAGTYSEVLPFVVDAYGRAVSRIGDAVHSEAGQGLSTMVGELCHPDPALRGDPVARRFGQDQYSLVRYVTRLDLLAKKIKVRRARAVT
jgi:hypothetical protein